MRGLLRDRLAERGRAIKGLTFVLAAILSVAGAVQERAQAPARGAARPTLLVSAAISLSEVLTELNAEAQKAVGAEILLNFGGSGSLRKQIEEGAPVDVFFASSRIDMDELAKKHLVDAASRRDILSNAVVLVGDKGAPSPKDIAALRETLRSADLLAIGNPDSVSAGRYAMQALDSLGLRSLVEKKLVLGGNVREVLRYVESGSAPLGIVFLTDAKAISAGSSVGVLFRFPDGALEAPILYPVAVVSASRAKAAAKNYVDFLRGESARRAFERAGFVVR